MEQLNSLRETEREKEEQLIAAKDEVTKLQQELETIVVRVNI